MFNSFFEARDELDRAILAAEITLAAPSLAIFRFVLSHAFYNGASYGFVNHKVCGTDIIAKLTGYSVRCVGDHLKYLEHAKLIHRRPRPIGTGGSSPDEITIVWVTFHDVDVPVDEAEPARGALSDLAEPAAPAPEPAAGANSFLDKKVKNQLHHQEPDDAVVGSSSSPSGENRGKGSTRPKASARSSSTARATTRAKDESLNDEGFASVEEYVLDLEGCAGDLEVRLFGVDDGQVDIKPLAKMLRNLGVRYGYSCLWSDILSVYPVGHKIWWQAGNKAVPVGYLLRLIELEMAKQNKEEEAQDDDLEARFLDLFTGREYLSGHRITELMPDMDFEVWKALKDRLLAEGKIVQNCSPPNSYKRADDQERRES